MNRRPWLSVTDRRILQDHVDSGFHAVDHGRVGYVLRRLGDADDHPGVLLREEALGDHDIEIEGEDDGPEHHHEGHEPVPQGDP